jgi:hypothetical protein
MENWCMEREALNKFACHYQTGEPIPEDLFQKMRRARNFRSANMQMRQLAFGMVDLKLHREYDPALHPDVMAYARDIYASFSPAPLPQNYGMIAGFTHLFSSPVAYGAGYYSYKWAEVWMPTPSLASAAKVFSTPPRAVITAALSSNAAIATTQRSCTANSWDAIPMPTRCSSDWACSPPHNVSASTYQHHHGLSLATGARPPR